MTAPITNRRPVASALWTFSLFTLLIAAMLLPSQLMAQLDTKHYIPPMYGREEQGCHYVVLSTPALSPFTVTITDGAGNVVATPTISNAASTTIPIGCNDTTRFLVAENELNNVMTDKGLILQATDPFYVNMRVVTTFQAGSLTSKGQNAALGTDFRTGHLYNNTGDAFRKSNMFGIMATEDNTTVTISDITPGVVFYGTTPTGAPLTSPDVTVVLDAGESYVMAAYLDDAQATMNVNGVNGTHITSDRPISVNTGTWLGGNAIVSGSPAAGRDLGIDQIVPLEKVGQEYVLIKGEGIDNEKTFVIATQNGTEVFLDGVATPVATLNAGEYYVIDGTQFSANDNLFVETTAPSYVYQTSNGSDGSTDDNERQCGLNFLPPVGCNGSKNVRLPDVDFIGTAFINIIADAGANVYVDGILQGAGDPVTGTSDYVTYKLTSGFTGDVIVDSDKLTRVALINLSGHIGAAGYFSGFTRDVSVQTNTVNADNIALEGCIQASFTFSLDELSTQPTTLSYTVGGTATNGVDYAWIDSLVTIPAGQISGTIFIDAIQDGLPEGQESIYIAYQPEPCAPMDTAWLFIDDAQPIEFTTVSTDLYCHNDSTGEILFNTTGGFPPYTYHITDSATGYSFTDTVNPVTGVAASTYYVQVYDIYGCKAEALVVGGLFNAGQTFLPDGSGVSYSTSLNINGFDPGQTLTNMNQLQNICANMEHSYLGDLIIDIECPSGQTVTLKGPGGGSCDLGEPIATAPVDGAASSTLTDPGVGYDYCWNENPIYGTMPGESNNWTRNYTDAQGHNYTDRYLPAGSYQSTQPLSGLLGCTLNGPWTIHVTDQYGLDNGYIFNWTISLMSDDPDTLVRVDEPEANQISGVITQAQCGGNDGAINISAIGDHVPFTFLWSNGATTEDISNLSAGSYTVWVTDTNNCTDSATFLLNNISSINIASYTTMPVSCAGGSDGAIDITVSGGTPPYTFSWSTGASTEDVTGVTVGLHTVSITDAAGCQFSQDIQVNGIPGMTITTVGIQNETCGDGAGGIDVSMSGGTGSYGYSWSNGATSQDISGISAGLYTLDVTDGNGCVVQKNFNVLNDVTSCANYCYLDVTGITVSDDACGQGTGAIDVTISNATNPYNVAWNHGPLTEDVNGLVEGDYTIVVNDAAGCIDSAVIHVGNNTGTLAISSSAIVDETCGGGQGSIDLSVSGGSLPYAYDWSTGATTEDISGLSAGSYTLQVTDGAGCILNQAFSLVNNTGTLAVSAQTVHDTCNSGIGSIDLTVTGGNGSLSYLWSNGLMNQDIYGLSAGSYSCTITDAAGCALTTPSYNIYNNAGTLSLANVDVNNEQCGQGDGSIDLTISGGSVPYTFIWSHGPTTEDVTSLNAGTYSATISDNNGCSVSTGNLTVFNAASTLAISTVFITDEICGNAMGAANVDVTGGSGSYTYSWSNGSTSQDLSNVSAGNYTLTVDDGSGCVQTHSVSIANTSGTLVVNNTIVTDESCGNGSGAIDLVWSGGTAPVSFSWSNGATTEDVSGLSQGTYTVDITDANGCMASTSATVNNIATGLTYTEVLTSEQCSNGTGAIDLTVSGGTAPYSFAWSSGQTTEDLTGLSAGTYSCVITDNNACSITTANFVITNNPGTLSLSTTVTDEVCGNAAGSVDLTVSGASGAPTFSWSHGPSTEDVSGLAAGNYSVTVTDASGCTATTSVTVVDVQGTLSLDGVVVTNEQCGNDMGAIDLTVSGGTAPLTFAWDHGPTTEDLSALDQGVYGCTITDANGCSVSTGNLTVSDDAGTLSIDNIIVANENCGNGLGSINLTVSGGTAPLSYSWAHGPTTEDVNNLSAGTYTCTITDALGCSVMTNSTVQNAASSLTLLTSVVTDQSCGLANGGIDIAVVGGSTPYSYQWSTGATSQDVSGLIAGSYSVQITDNNGCTITHSEVVTNAGGNPSISSSAISDEICGNMQGAVDITVSGGVAPYSFTWSNGAFTEDISGLSAGTYSVDINDGNGCTTIGSFTVAADNGTLAIGSTVVTDENCGDGMGGVDVTVTGGNAPLSYAWDNGSTTQDLMAISAGTYILVVTDQFGCSASTNAVVANNGAGFSVATNSVTDENCGDMAGAVDITASGGLTPYTFDWSNGATTEDISGLSAGTYDVTVTDGNGCMFSVSETVNNVTTGITLTGSTVQDENCSDGTGYIDLSISGGVLPYTYAWSNSATTEDISGLNAGNYTCVITDNNGCSVNYSGVVGNTQGVTLSSVVQNELCGNSNGSIAVTVTSGLAPFTYNWTGGSPDTCCTYTLEMFDTFGDGWNNGFLTVTVNGVSQGTFSAVGNGSQATFNACSGDSISLEYTPGNFENENSYNLLDPSSNVLFSDGPTPTTGQAYWTYGNCPAPPVGYTELTNLSAGTYIVEVVDDVGCSASDTFNVSNIYNPALAFNNVNVSDEDCGAGNGWIWVQPTGGFNYTYEIDGQPNGGAFFNNLVSGTYTITVYDGNGCSIDTTVTVNSTLVFSAQIVSVTPNNCGLDDGTIDVQVSPAGAYTYAWSHGPTTEDVSGLATGPYTVSVSDGVCTLDLDTVIVDQAGFTASVTSVTDENCTTSNGAIDITVTGGSGSFTYAWLHGATTEDVTGLAAGSYEVTITDQVQGCQQTLTATLVSIPTTMTLFSTIVDDTCGQGVGSIDLTLTGGNGPFSYVWNAAPPTPDITGLGQGTYSVTVTDAVDGCQITESYVVGNQTTFTVSGLVTDATCGTCPDGAVDVTLGGTPGQPVTYNWDNGATTEDINGLLPGTYVLTTTDANGCTAVDTFQVVNSIGLGELGAWKVEIYPNPAQDEFYLEYRLPAAGEVTIELFDVLGQQIAQREGQQSEGLSRFEPEIDSDGVLFLRLTQGGVSRVYRVVVIR